MTGLAWWLWWLVGGPIVLIGAWLVRRALAKDPDAGRRRCPSCWYVMEGVPGLRCPECGLEAEDEPSLRRTRRSWRLAGAGLIVIALGYAVGRGHAVVTSWRGLVPTTALLWTEPMEIWDREWTKDDTLYAKAPWGLELLYRYEEGSLADWQSRWLMDRDMERMVEVPRVWMAGEPFEVKVNAFWTAAVKAPRTLHVRLEGLETGDLSVPLRPIASWGTGARFPQRAGMHMRCPSRKLAPLSAGDHELKIAMTLQEGSGPSAVTVWKGQVNRRLRVVADPLEAVAAEDSQLTAQVIRDLYGMSLDVTNGRALVRHTWNWFGLQGAKYSRPNPDVTITADVEFLYDGRVMWKVPMAGYLLGRPTYAPAPTGFLMTQPATRTDPKWMVRIRSVPSRALKNFDVQRIWVGEVLIPASEICPQPLGEPIPPPAGS